MNLKVGYLALSVFEIMASTAWSVSVTRSTEFSLVPLSELIGFADMIMSPACLARVTRLEAMVGRSAFQHLSLFVMMSEQVVGKVRSIIFGNPRGDFTFGNQIPSGKCQSLSWSVSRQPRSV